ncbi:hypothetical protein ACWGR3_31350, partial [Streptomyces albidoflavus]
MTATSEGSAVELGAALLASFASPTPLSDAAAHITSIEYADLLLVMAGARDQAPSREIEIARDSLASLEEEGPILMEEGLETQKNVWGLSLGQLRHALRPDGDSAELREACVALLLENWEKGWIEPWECGFDDGSKRLPSFHLYGQYLPSVRSLKVTGNGSLEIHTSEGSRFVDPGSFPPDASVGPYGPITLLGVEALDAPIFEGVGVAEYVSATSSAGTLVSDSLNQLRECAPEYSQWVCPVSYTHLR